MMWRRCYCETDMFISYCTVSNLIFIVSVIQARNQTGITLTAYEIYINKYPSTGQYYHFATPENFIIELM